MDTDDYDITSERSRLTNLIRYCTTCIRFSDDAAEQDALRGEIAAFQAELRALAATGSE